MLKSQKVNLSQQLELQEQQIELRELLNQTFQIEEEVNKIQKNSNAEQQKVFKQENSYQNIQDKQKVEINQKVIQTLQILSILINTLENLEKKKYEQDGACNILRTQQNQIIFEEQQMLKRLMQFLGFEFNPDQNHFAFIVKNDEKNQQNIRALWSYYRNLEEQTQHYFFIYQRRYLGILKNLPEKFQIQIYEQKQSQLKFLVNIGKNLWEKYIQADYIEKYMEQCLLQIFELLNLEYIQYYIKKVQQYNEETHQKLEISSIVQTEKVEEQQSENQNKLNNFQKKDIEYPEQFKVEEFKNQIENSLSIALALINADKLNPKQLNFNFKLIVTFLFCYMNQSFIVDDQINQIINEPKFEASYIKALFLLQEKSINKNIQGLNLVNQLVIQQKQDVLTQQYKSYLIQIILESHHLIGQHPINLINKFITEKQIDIEQLCEILLSETNEMAYQKDLYELIKRCTNSFQNDQIKVWIQFIKKNKKKLLKTINISHIDLLYNISISSQITEISKQRIFSFFISLVCKNYKDLNQEISDYIFVCIEAMSKDLGFNSEEKYYRFIIKCINRIKRKNMSYVLQQNTDQKEQQQQSSKLNQITSVSSNLKIINLILESIESNQNIKKSDYIVKIFGEQNFMVTLLDNFSFIKKIYLQDLKSKPKSQKIQCQKKFLNSVENRLNFIKFCNNQLIMKKNKKNLEKSRGFNNFLASSYNPFNMNNTSSNFNQYINGFVDFQVINCLWENIVHLNTEQNYQNIQLFFDFVSDVIVSEKENNVNQAKEFLVHKINEISLDDFEQQTVKQDLFLNLFVHINVMDNRLIKKQIIKKNQEGKNKIIQYLNDFEVNCYPSELICFQEFVKLALTQNIQENPDRKFILKILVFIFLNLQENLQQYVWEIRQNMVAIIYQNIIEAKEQLLKLDYKNKEQFVFYTNKLRNCLYLSKKIFNKTETIDVKLIEQHAQLSNGQKLQIIIHNQCSNTQKLSEYININIQNTNTLSQLKQIVVEQTQKSTIKTNICHTPQEINMYMNKKLLSTTKNNYTLKQLQLVSGQQIVIKRNDNFSIKRENQIDITQLPKLIFFNTFPSVIEDSLILMQLLYNQGENKQNELLTELFHFLNSLPVNDQQNNQILHIGEYISELQEYLEMSRYPYMAQYYLVIILDNLEKYQIVLNQQNLLQDSKTQLQDNIEQNLNQQNVVNNEQQEKQENEQIDNLDQNQESLQKDFYFIEVISKFLSGINFQNNKNDYQQFKDNFQNSLNLTQLKGISNLGNTCHFNAMFQQLINIGSFRQFIMQIKINNKQMNTQQDRKQQDIYINNEDLKINNDNYDDSNEFLFNLQQLSIKYCLDKKKYINPQFIFNKMKDIITQGFQQDVQETMFSFINKLENELKPTIYNGILQQIFEGKIINQIICDKCHKNTQYEQNIFNINIQVNHFYNLQEALKEYIKPKSVEKKCEHCQDSNKKTQIYHLEKFPNILIMQLNRFQYDQKKQETQKLNSEFSFPESLNLESFASQYFEQAKQLNKNKSFLMESYLQKQSVLRSEEWKYNLKGVIIHKGDSAESGHYYSLVKVFDKQLNQYQWKKLDDNYVTTFNFEQMKQECYGGNDNEKSAYILIYEKEIQQNLQLSIVHNEDNKNDEQNQNMQKQELQEIKNQLGLRENDIQSLEIPEKQFSNSRLVDLNAFKFYFNNISHEIYEISLYQDQFFYNFMVNQVQKFIQYATQKYLLNDQNQIKSNLIENQLNAMNNFQIPKNVEILHLMNEKEKEITNQIIQILEILIFKSLENEQRTLMLGELSQILEFSPQLANQFLKNVQIENLIYDKIQKLHQSQKFKLQLNYFLIYIIKIVQRDQQNIFEYLVFLKSILPLTGMVINEDQYVDDVFLQQFDKLCLNEKQICVNCESENKLSQINCQVCSLRIDKFQKRCVNMNCNLKSDINSNYCRCGQSFNQEVVENIYENCKYCNMPNERGMNFCKNETCVFYNQPFTVENQMIQQQQLQQQKMQYNAYNIEDNNKLEQKKENKNYQGQKSNQNKQEQKLGINQNQDINKKKKDKKKGCNIF